MMEWISHSDDFRQEVECRKNPLKLKDSRALEDEYTQ